MVLWFHLWNMFHCEFDDVCAVIASAEDLNKLCFCFSAGFCLSAFNRITEVNYIAILGRVGLATRVIWLDCEGDLDLAGFKGATLWQRERQWKMLWKRKEVKEKTFWRWIPGYSFEPVCERYSFRNHIGFVWDFGGDGSPRWNWKMAVKMCVVANQSVIYCWWGFCRTMVETWEMSCLLCGRHWNPLRALQPHSAQDWSVEAWEATWRRTVLSTWCACGVQHLFIWHGSCAAATVFHSTC